MMCLARARGLLKATLPPAAVLLALAGRAAHGQPVPMQPVTWLTAPLQDSLVGPVSGQSELRGESGIGPASLRIRKVKQDSARTTIYCSVLDREGEPVFEIGSKDLKCSLNGQAVRPVGFELLALSADEHLVTVLALGFKDTAVSAPRMVSALSGSFVPELEEGKADLCALLTFSGRVAVPRLFTSDPLLLQRALSSIHFSGEGLVVNAAIDAARTLIRQHDTSGFGAVVLACDAGPSDSAGPPGIFPALAAEGIPIFGVSVARKGAGPHEALASLCAASRGELFVSSADSVAMRTAVSRVIRILQRQVVIQLPASSSGRFRLEYKSDGDPRVLSDSVILASLWPAPKGEPDVSPRSRLVIMSLVVGAILLVLILLQHAKTRTR